MIRAVISPTQKAELPHACVYYAGKSLNKRFKKWGLMKKK